MNKKTFDIQGSNINISAAAYLPDGEVKAILQVTHGMTEHFGRYENLAQKLTQNNIALVGYDLRGHGKNPGSKDVASFGEGKWNDAIDDIHCVYEHMKKIYPSAPYFMLGFSLGSFLLREYLGKYDDNLSGAIIMGTGNQPSFVLSIIMGIVKTQIKKGGFDGTTDPVRNLSFGTYNKKFTHNRTHSDWLCADEKELDKYNSDELCRKDISSGLFYDLLGSMKRTGNKAAYSSWNKNMPILLISGKDDTVGDMGKGVESVRKQMLEGGIKDVKMSLIGGARHDLLHEYENYAADDAIEKITEFIKINC